MTLPKISENKLLAFVFILVVIVTCLRIYEKSLVISTEHLDGVYQTYNALNRISQGDIIGKDFYPYLGFGPSLSTYPLFALSGKSVYSSQLSSYIVIITFWVISLFTLSKFSPLSKLSKGTFFTVLLFIYLYYAGHISPGNSLLGARSFIVIIAAFSIYNFLLKRESLFLLGTSLSIVLLWSNDYGIPTAITMCGVIFFYYKSILNKKILKIFSVFLIMLFVISLVITKNNIFEYMNYTINVAQDQFWYFVSYDEKDKYYSLSDLLLFWDHGVNKYSIVLLASTPLLITLIYTIKKFNRNDTYVLLTLYLATFGAGLLSEIGGHKSLHYYSMHLAIFPFVALHLLYVYKESQVVSYIVSNVYVNSILNKLMHGRLYIPLFFMSFVLISALLFVVNKISNIKNNYIFEGSLGGYVSKNDIELLDISRITGKDNSLLSEYAGLPNALSNLKNKLNSDSVIHALGNDVRENYKILINNNDYMYATTTNPMHSYWQAWSFHQNWYFYKNIIAKFEPEKQSPQLILWKKRKSAENKKKFTYSTICKINEMEKNKLKLLIDFDSSMRKKLFEVSIEYQLGFDEGLIPVIGRNKLIRVEGSLMQDSEVHSFTISPYTDAVKFPVYFKNNSETFTLTSYPKSRTILKIKKCTINFISDNELILKSVLPPHKY